MEKVISLTVAESNFLLGVNAPNKALLPDILGILMAQPIFYCRTYFLRIFYQTSQVFLGSKVS